MNRSTDTEDYMKIELAPGQSVCQEPPKPPPLPPPPMAVAPNLNGDSNGQSSKTNTINSKNGNGNGNGLQDTATRKQQQPLSAISIQDLNSVQVYHNSRKKNKNFQNSQVKASEKNKFNSFSFLVSASTNRKSFNENLLNANTQREHAMLVFDK